MKNSKLSLNKKVIAILQGLMAWGEEKDKRKRHASSILHIFLLTQSCIFRCSLSLSRWLFVRWKFCMLIYAMAAAYMSRGFKNLNLAPAAGEKRETLVAIFSAEKCCSRHLKLILP